MQPGEARVRLVYRRAWEEGVEPAQEAVFDVVVADAR
jgi:predicted secreted protein